MHGHVVDAHPSSSRLAGLLRPGGELRRQPAVCACAAGTAITSAAPEITKDRLRLLMVSMLCPFRWVENMNAAYGRPATRTAPQETSGV